MRTTPQRVAFRFALCIPFTLHACLSPLRAEDDSAYFFQLRAWQTQVDRLWCNSRPGSDHWYKNPFYLNYLDEVLEEASAHGANALILMGRGNHAEIPTFISYRAWPRLNDIYESRNHKDRELQIEKLNELIAKAKSRGVDIYLWSHELHIPSELPKKYPRIAGDGARYCPSEPKLWRFVSSKYDEFLDRVPGIAGILLVMSETQSNLLHGSPCKCKRCKTAPREKHLENVIRAVYTPLNKRGKRLMVRTFGHSTDECRAIITAMNHLPRDLEITVMSKGVPQDFKGLRYPDHPAFTTIKDRPQCFEDVFGEFRGKNHVIVTPVRFYRERIRRAASHGVRNIAMRLDHNGWPESPFKTPNRFNIYFVSQLWKNPDVDPEKVWKEWFTKRYGEEAAPALIQAFKNTEDIWEHSTNTLGVYTLSAHASLAPLFRGPYHAWGNLKNSVYRITKGFPKWDQLGNELLQPSEETLSRIRAEIEDANELADDSLRLVREASKNLSKEDAKELAYYFELSRLAMAGGKTGQRAQVHHRENVPCYLQGRAGPHHRFGKILSLKIGFR